MKSNLKEKTIEELKEAIQFMSRYQKETRHSIIKEGLKIHLMEAQQLLKQKEAEKH